MRDAVLGTKITTVVLCIICVTASKHKIVQKEAFEFVLDESLTLKNNRKLSETHITSCRGVA
jgi:hypothetical protein